jgi:transcriptional regulator PpsR
MAVADKGSFNASQRIWGELDASAAAALVSASSDLALVVSASGVIEDVAVGKADLPAAFCSSWVGKRWTDIVAPESVVKFDSLADDAKSGDSRPWRHVNHPLPGGSELPIQYRAALLNGGRQVVAFGRDMRDLAQLQQRLVEAQQVVERDYWRLRSVETRYRLLFDRAVDGLIIVDASGSNKVLEGNEAAAQILGIPLKRLLGQAFPAGLPERSRKELSGLIGRVRSGGRSEEFLLKGHEPPNMLRVTVSPFAQDDQAQLLVRLQYAQGKQSETASGRQALVTHSMDRLPDGCLLYTSDAADDM